MKTLTTITWSLLGLDEVIDHIHDKKRAPVRARNRALTAKTTVSRAGIRSPGRASPSERVASRSGNSINMHISGAAQSHDISVA